ncbi:hypothetical protein GCM10011494_10070 [Novosphingobium endophyticum]|uniref:Secreted protein n=1 Tax=Novosphingobium endophyticum TaxID=1955250 RepID=A0A916TQY2_9SPHN|nr:hypothetical protein [Novosphingobium endophyticum]GGB93636.1 hypothetical protein GCM10011494_10070 [Novosphingobium endophyticum]
MITITPLELTIGLIVLAVIVAVGVVYMRKRRADSLKARFGGEYERTVKDAGSSHRAETILHEREKRVESFDIRPLSPESRRRYIEEWRKVQTRFVDSPADAVTRADVLLGQVMEDRGYPVADFEQRSADLSVDHGDVVQNYRAGHTIAERHARGEADTEDLRQAMIHYRALFDDLVHEPVDSSPVIEHRDGRVIDKRKKRETHRG